MSNRNRPDRTAGGLLLRLAFGIGIAAFLIFVFYPLACRVILDLAAEMSQPRAPAGHRP